MIQKKKKFLSPDEIKYIVDNFVNVQTKILAEKLGCSVRTIERYGRELAGLKKDHSITRTLHKINEKYFDIVGPNQSYYLGFLMADGCVRNNTLSFNLQVQDAYIIENFNKELVSEYKIRIGPGNSNTKYKDYNYALLKITNTYLTNKLKQLNIIHRKTGQEKFPN
jgi:hypothetical protein